MKRWATVATLTLGLLGAGCVPPPNGTNGPPPAPTGLQAQSGGGSGEVFVTWDPLPAAVGVASYHVYEVATPGTRLKGQFWLLAVVTNDALGQFVAGRFGIVDSPDLWPWPNPGPIATQRCYVLTAVSTQGLEGAMSPQICGSPP